MFMKPSGEVFDWNTPDPVPKMRKSLNQDFIAEVGVRLLLLAVFLWVFSLSSHAENDRAQDYILHSVNTQQGIRVEPGLAVG